MTTASRLSFLGLALLLVIVGFSAHPTTAKAESLTMKADIQIKPQLVHRRHRGHRWHRHHWKHHHHRHVPRFGVHIHRLPRGYFGIRFGGVRFFVHSGVFYRPAGSGFVVVKAPYGAVVASLPHGHHVIHRGGNTYYHYNDTYYARNSSGAGFVVVAEPVG